MGALGKLIIDAEVIWANVAWVLDVRGSGEMKLAAGA
jgi:hypothetical protein